MKIAIVGSGISGLGASYLLHKQADITVFEQDLRIGGHANTVTVDYDGTMIQVDTGFIVYNPPNYPHFVGMLDHIGAPHTDSVMSFSVSSLKGDFEYAGSGLGTLFAQKRHLVDWRFLKMIAEIKKFNQTTPVMMANGQLKGMNLGALLSHLQLSDYFTRRYLLPMGSAIWSASLDDMATFPAEAFIRFFKNHGLLNMVQQLGWRTIVGGSSAYVDRLTRPFANRIETGVTVVALKRMGGKVELFAESGPLGTFDHVILAGHADQSLKILGEHATNDERAILGQFQYQANRAVLHRDIRLLPKRRKVWSSWNYQIRPDDDGKQRVGVSYWMNRLQPHIPQDKTLVVSLNPILEPVARSIFAEFQYTHPLFNQNAIDAQGKLAEIQGRDGVWFCGSYFGYGFHEDGLESGANVAQALGVKLPWKLPSDFQPRTPALQLYPGMSQAA